MHETASRTAKNLTDARFGQAPKIKINRAEYLDIIKATYLLSQRNATSDARTMLAKIFKEELDPEVILAELDIAIVQSHNLLVNKTKYGRLSFNEMKIEDIIYNAPLEKLLKPKPKMKTNGFRL